MATPATTDSMARGRRPLPAESPEKTWPATSAESRPLSKLRGYEKNSRTHSAEQIKQVADSIEHWGWTMPILVDESDGIIAGHCRALAAADLGIETVPVVVAKGWSKADRRAYVMADNQLALNAGWDDDMRQAEIVGLEGAGFDLSLLGFDADALATILNDGEGLTDPDDVPETPETPVSVIGDLWLLGDHRLVCGDSTKSEDVLKVLDAVIPHLMVTDPPYGVGHDGVLNDDKADWREAFALFGGNVAYAWHADLRAKEAIEALQACDFILRAQIIWAKSALVRSRGHYHFQHEPCWYAVRSKNGGTGHWQGDRTQSTLWQIDKPHKSETGHSTQKPIECMRRPIVNNSKPGQAVYDPFLGSGTTIIAAEMEGRHCLGLELHPPYCDVIINRWQDFTGQEAKHESGKTFEQMAADREVS